MNTLEIISGKCATQIPGGCALSSKNSPTLNPDEFVRLSKILMETRGVSYEEAIDILHGFQLQIVADEELHGSPSKQAALITAVATGIRSFLGGVAVSMPLDIPLCIHWPGHQSLNSVVSDLLSNKEISSNRNLPAIVIGAPQILNEDCIYVHCDGWRAGVSTTGLIPEFFPGPDFAVGGVAAGALAVNTAFVRALGLDNQVGDEPLGISFWKPNDDWLSEFAVGPKLENLPQRIWVLGLGHLGQGFLWSYGLLPFQNPSNATMVLQDFDRVVKANWVAGLLCDENTWGKHKTRISSKWLEQRGIQTVLVERKFDQNTRREESEPSIAFCGFDDAQSRRILDLANFDLVVECGLGSGVDSFDKISLHVLGKGTRRSESLWPVNTKSETGVNANIIKMLDNKSGCGVLAETLAKLSISVSFVGAFAGALALSEVLRAYHGEGDRLEFLDTQLRTLSRRRMDVTTKYLPHIAATNGFLPCS